MSHRREIVGDSGRIEAFQAFFEVVKKCFGELTPPKDEMLGKFTYESILSVSLAQNASTCWSICLFHSGLGCIVCDLGYSTILLGHKKDTIAANPLNQSQPNLLSDQMNHLVL